MKAVIKLEVENARKARSLFRAVIPDNVFAPKYLRIGSLIRGRQIVFTIETPRLDTLVSTVDDLLSCIQGAEKSVIAIEKSDRV